MRNILFLFMLIFSPFYLNGQNLIPNPGFEGANVCETYEERCTPEGWRNILLKAFQFPEASYMRVSLLFSPHGGKRSAAIPTYHKSRKNDRVFIQTPLLCELIKGQEYEFSFYYLLMSESVKSMGLLFADSLVILGHNTEIIGRKPDIDIPLRVKGGFKTWQKFTIKYTAKGNERGIIFGNFTPDEQVQLEASVKLKRKVKPPKGITIWLDDFNISAVGDVEHDCDLEKNRQRIYKDDIRHYKKGIVMPIKGKGEREEPPTLASLPNGSDEPKEQVGTPPSESPVIAMEEAADTLIEIDNKPTENAENVLIENKIVTPDKFVLTNINFQTNSKILFQSAYPALDSIVDFMNENPSLHIQIFGHTDSRGSADFNMALSQKRAEAVADYLLEKGLGKERISHVGRGEEDPAYDNDTAEGRARNRRVEFIIKPPSASSSP